MTEETKDAGQLVKSEKSGWEKVKQKIVQLAGGLIMEKNKDGIWTVSLGRVSWWFIFLPALFIWITGNGILSGGEALKDISPNHLTVLLTLAAYNFGKKSIDAIRNILGK